ncbi:MAG: CoA-binding protein [Marinilabiliaceae bacterium]|nr:CoA-binding protein [Marinilabiliaceae bacterium]
MKNRKSQIDAFFSTGSIAIAGVSRHEKKFGRVVYNDLRKSGYDVLAINPNLNEIQGDKCYADVNELPEEVESLLIVTPKKETDEVLRNAITKGIKNIWVQQASDTDRTLKIAEEYNKEIICKKCIFMFAEPVSGFHKFHRTIVKFLGQLPK